MYNLKRFAAKIPLAVFAAKLARLFFFMIKSPGALRYLLHAPPGHFYSPLPDYAAGVARVKQLESDDSKEIAGIDLREAAQLELLDRFAEHYTELPYSQAGEDGTLYRFDNEFFGHGDAIILYSMLRHFGPKRIVEVGSGFSSAVMLDVNRMFFENSMQITFVEPYPDRLYTLMSGTERSGYEVIEKPVQTVPLDLFRDADLLFVDSSHVAKVGSDVLHIIFNVLPSLKAGTLIHFHDIGWPFEYWKEALLEGVGWNEAYFLRAFLQDNPNYEIVCFNSFMGRFHQAGLGGKLPLCLKNPGGSLWLRKTG